MERAEVDGITLEYEVSGSGEPVVCIHGARRITQPVLAVLGSESDALWHRFGETQRLLLEWLPQAEGFVLPGATNGLQMQNPRGLAEALASFARHSLSGRETQGGAW